MSSVIEEICRVLVISKRPSVLTGAGISRESGIPTYRDVDDGYWSQPEVRRLATVAGLHESPAQVWEFFQQLREKMCAAQPNTAHKALVELETMFTGLPVITQNIDDLHERAGNRRVIHLHGLITQTRCSRYCRGIPSIVDENLIDKTRETTPPHCPYCDSLLRPHVTLMGEYLHSEPLQMVDTICTHTDVLLVIGTSGVVAPASEIPSQAKRYGAKIIEINPSASAITEITDYCLPETANEALNKIVSLCRLMLR